jgi:hypothetical protein
MASERTSRPEVADSAGNKRNPLAPETSTAADRPARTGGARDGV